MSLNIKEYIKDGESFRIILSAFFFKSSFWNYEENDKKNYIYFCFFSVRISVFHSQGRNKGGEEL